MMPTSMNSQANTQKPPKRVFFAAVIIIFFSALSAADSVGFVPCYFDGTECSTATSEPTASAGTLALSSLPELGAESIFTPEVAPVLPTRIKISAVDLDLAVQNPDTRNIAALDVLLKKGPIRYVDSAKLGQSGNVLIFAHSSSYPVVRNQMYKAFNRISELKAGDSITLTGDGKDYVYTVTSVRTADVDEALIDLSPTQGKKLTLVTCDNLTGKSARFIVEADFVGTL